MSDKKIIFSMVGVSKKVNDRKIIKDISLSFFYGAKIGILGLNGSGKSSLLRIIAGKDQDYNGEVHVSEGYTIGMLEQEPTLQEGKTVQQIVEEAVGPVMDLLKQFEDINMKFAEGPDADEMEKLIEQQAKVQERLDAADAWSIQDKLNFAMESLRCPPADQLVDHLSGGERRRVALCRLLLQKPDILLLDEPTNHLDADSVHWLEQHLAEYEGTVLAVTHDRYFLDNVAGWILELDRGHGVPWQGNYSSWLFQKERRLSQEKKSESKRIKTLQRELEWINMAPRARGSKSKARVNSYEKLLNQDHQKQNQDLRLYIPAGPRLGNIVIETKDLKKSYEDKLLFENMTFTLPAGGIVGIVGPNGAGKTSLFKLITGSEKPDSGELVVGETVKVGYMEQSRLALDESKTVWEVVSGGAETITLGKQEIQSRAYVAKFNFSGQDQQKKVGMLSGGERNRLQLALLVKDGANVILLDEPTNDLDINTLRALEEALLNFGGCAVVISHDRWFLDRVATHILAFEGESKTYWYNGNFSDYEEDRIKRLGADAGKPKRIRYAKITR